MEINPIGSLYFGVVTQNATENRSFTLSNSGNSNITVSSILIDGEDKEQFNVVSPTNSTFKIPPGGTQEITVQFSPDSEGSKLASLIIYNDSDNKGQETTVSLNGNGSSEPAKTLETTPAYSWDFGNVSINTTETKDITLENTGTVTVTVSEIEMDGNDAGQFSLADPDNTSFEIPAGTTRNILINFNPSSEGLKNISLNIYNNSDNTNAVKAISLSGTGTPEPTRKLYITPEYSLNFGIVKVNTSKDKTFTIENTGTENLTISELKIEGNDKEQFNLSDNLNFPVEVPAGATQQFTIRFIPNSIDGKSAYLQILNNSDNESPVKIITLNGSGTLQQVTATRIKPSGSTFILNSNNPVNFIVQGKCTEEELNKVEWYINNIFQATHNTGFNGNSDTDKWSNSFASAGNYTITAKVFDTDGNSASVSWQVTINPYLEISKNRIEFNNTAGSTETFKINSNTTWSVTSNKNWIQVTPSQGSNDKTIAIQVLSKNPNKESREAIISVTCSGIEKTLTIVQKGNNNPPSKPVLIKPTNSSHQIGKITYNWKSCVDTDGDDITYSIYKGASIDSLTLWKKNLTKTYVDTHKNNEKNWIVFWKIVASDGISETESDIWRFYITPTSSQFYELNNIKIYPNPTNHLLTIEFATAPQKYSIEFYNNLGQLIIQKKSSSRLEQLDLKGNVSGIYYLKIYNNEFLKTQKIVVR